MTVSPAWVKGLTWIAAHEPVGLFPIEGPSRSIRRKLEAAKLIEQCPRTKLVQLIMYRLTQAGRDAMAGKK